MSGDWRTEQAPGSPARDRLVDALATAAGESSGIPAVAAVIERAGASRSTFYKHFDDAADCYLQALARFADQLQQAAAQVLADRHCDPAPAVAGLLVDFARDRRSSALLLFCSSLSAGPPALALRDRLIDRLASMLQRALPRAASPRRIDLPPLALIGGIFRLLSLRLPEGDAGLHGLPEAVSAWVCSYALTNSRPSWHGDAARTRLPSVAADPLPAMPAPERSPRGRHGLPASAVAASQRERLLLALAHLSLRHGYAQVTVSQVVSAAAVSREVFYEHFPDMGAAALAALQQHSQHTVALAAKMLGPGGWPQRMLQLLQALSADRLAHPAQAHLSLVELHAIGPQAVALTRERLRVLTLLLQEGQALRSEPLPHLACEAILATLFELAYRQAPQRQRKRRPLLLAQELYMALAPFIGAEAAVDLLPACPPTHERPPHRRRTRP